MQKLTNAGGIVLKNQEWKPELYLLYSIMNISLAIGIPTITLYVDHWAIYCCGFILSAAIFIGFSNAAHECTHNLFTPWKRTNLIIGSMWMTPLLLNFIVHRNYHLKHHSKTTRLGDPEFDFEYGEFHSLSSYLFKIASWLTIFNSLYSLNWGNSVQALLGKDTEFLDSEKKVFHSKCASLVILIWVTVALICTFFYPKALFVGYWLPILFFTPLLAYITALPEHYGVNYGKLPKLNTRTIECNRIISTLFWHFNFHTSHHVKPKTHFYDLEKVHNQSKKEFLYIEKSYLVFHIKLIQKLIS